MIGPVKPVRSADSDIEVLQSSTIDWRTVMGQAILTT